MNDIIDKIVSTLRQFGYIEDISTTTTSPKFTINVDSVALDDVSRSQICRWQHSVTITIRRPHAGDASTLSSARDKLQTDVTTMSAHLTSRSGLICRSAVDCKVTRSRLTTQMSDVVATLDMQILTNRVVASDPSHNSTQDRYSS